MQNTGRTRGGSRLVLAGVGGILVAVEFMLALLIAGLFWGVHFHGANAYVVIFIFAAFLSLGLVFLGAGVYAVSKNRVMSSEMEQVRSATLEESPEASSTC